MKNSKLQVTIPTKLKDKGEKAVKEMGFNSLQDYLRVVIANLPKSNQMVNFTSIPQTTEEEERGIAASLDDIRKGRYKILRSEKDIDNFIDGISDSNND